EEPAIGGALDVPRHPDAGRSSVGEKHGVVGSQRASCRREIFWADWLEARTFVHVMAQQLLELSRLRKVLFEEAGVIFRMYFRQYGRERRLHVSDKTEIQRRPAAEVLRIRVDLDFFHVAVRQKLGKRKICPEQQKKIGAVNRVVRSAVAQ